jgi:flagellar protein FlbD
VIRLTRRNDTEIIVNSELIELIETTPDTLITLTTGEKIVVRESSDVVVRRATEYRRYVLSGVHTSSPASFESDR